ncbi:MAG: DUF1802 family protein [Planctomycetaceae bacterium]
MSDVNCWALKEWAAVCAALANGHQTILFRKGGIAEGPAGFQIQHPVFWLLPTRFHQSPDEFQPGDAELLRSPLAAAPPAGQLAISLFARCERVVEVSSETQLNPLLSQQVLAAATVHERFHYRRPGLFVLLLRVYSTPTPMLVADDPAYAGCHSWVNLTRPLSTAGLSAVLTDDQFATARRSLDGLTGGDL